VRLTENDKRTLRRFEGDPIIDMRRLADWRVWRMTARRLSQLAAAGYLLFWRGECIGCCSPPAAGEITHGFAYSITKAGIMAREAT